MFSGTESGQPDGRGFWTNITDTFTKIGTTVKPVVQDIVVPAAQTYMEIERIKAQTEAIKEQKLRTTPSILPENQNFKIPEIKRIQAPFPVIKKQAVPTWIWYAGGGVLGLTVLMLIMKK